MVLGRTLQRLVSSSVPAGRTYSQYFRKKNPYLNFKLMSSNEPANASAPELFKPLVWIDCEMTGLDHTKDRIIEICCIVTDGHLKIVDDNCYESVIHCDPDVMSQMNEWCIEHHGKSGLTKKVVESVKAKEDVERELLQFIQRYVPQAGVGVLAGNSVHMDRLFMLKDFPKIIDHLFYRIVDVSSLMEISFRHNPTLANVAPRKDKNHTAKSDILESIEQLQWYRDNYLKAESETQSFVREQEKAQAQVQAQAGALPLEHQTPAAEKRPIESQGQLNIKSRKI